MGALTGVFVFVLSLGTIRAQRLFVLDGSYVRNSSYDVQGMSTFCDGTMRIDTATLQRNSTENLDETLMMPAEAIWLDDQQCSGNPIPMVRRPDYKYRTTFSNIDEFRVKVVEGFTGQVNGTLNCGPGRSVGSGALIFYTTTGGRLTWRAHTMAQDMVFPIEEETIFLMDINGTTRGTLVPTQFCGLVRSQACFPASAVVTLASGEAKQISELDIGDRVRSTGSDTFSEVYLFSHRTKAGFYPFVEISTQDAGSIRLSSRHYLYVEDRLVQASEVRIGDQLVTSTGEHVAVTETRTVYDSGLYAPHTLDGDIEVNGFRSSTYTAHVPAHFAHCLLGPIRLLYRMTKWSILGSALESDPSFARAFGQRLLPLLSRL